MSLYFYITSLRKNSKFSQVLNQSCLQWSPVRSLWNVNIPLCSENFCNTNFDIFFPTCYFYWFPFLQFVFYFPAGFCWVNPKLIIQITPTKEIQNAPIWKMLKKYWMVNAQNSLLVVSVQNALFALVFNYFVSCLYKEKQKLCRKMKSLIKIENVLIK